MLYEVITDIIYLEKLDLDFKPADQEVINMFSIITHDDLKKCMSLYNSFFLKWEKEYKNDDYTAAVMMCEARKLYEENNKCKMISIMLADMIDCIENQHVS